MLGALMARLTTYCSTLYYKIPRTQTDMLIQLSKVEQSFNQGTISCYVDSEYTKSIGWGRGDGKDQKQDMMFLVISDFYTSWRTLILKIKDWEPYFSWEKARGMFLVIAKAWDMTKKIYCSLPISRPGVAEEFDFIYENFIPGALDKEFYPWSTRQWVLR